VKIRTANPPGHRADSHNSATYRQFALDQDISCATLVPEQGINKEALLAKLPAANMGSGAAASEGADFPPFSGPSAFQRELERARRHLARLEAEEELRVQQPVVADDRVQFDESPVFVRTCNVLIWAIIVLPIAVAVIALARKLIG
jgi:hypothetical protein